MRTLIRILDEANVTAGLQFIYPDSVTLRPFSAIVRLLCLQLRDNPLIILLARSVPQLGYVPCFSCW
ncbi:hypothetical protein AGR3A_Cc160091 [Agrobacterium tomkonis CFBP 6623]|uniref:Uncharacterized protein n=1 Tax=Agrobacterium tomkonis CFBP 6623 TaxID=1183432 RepID=A0A1S7NSS1_9HYPH|nr:hypothetical protein AGR3A_Cc160091 [Agrobacterium tomkonis CFBP 6623]